jgi:F-type H+-transporting ATPase subunit b
MSMLVACALLCACSGLLAQESPDPAPPAVTTTAPAKHAEDAGHSHTASAGHAGGDHAHDELDNTHKDATAGLSAPQEMRFDLAVATFAIFLLLSIILAKFAWGPITQGLDKREASIAAMIDQARLAQEQAEAQLRSYEAKLAAAAEEARSLVAQARIDADATRERELAITKAENEKLLQRNKDEIEAAKNAALQQIAERSVSTAISLASSIVRREVKPEDHDALVTDALGKFSKLN